MSDAIHPMFDPESVSDQERARLNNLRGLVEAEIDPYPARGDAHAHGGAGARSV